MLTAAAATMANRTAKYAVSVRGTNPQFLVHPMIRTRIYECKYWKENCTLLNSALVLSRAVDDLKYVGGIYGGNTKITPFLCLTLKLLQIQPIRDIVYFYMEQTEFKYLRALGALYLRFIGSPVEIYTKLEPLYKDFRKLRIMDTNHKFSMIHMDEFIDQLLHEENILGVTLPRLTKRMVLEDNRDIQPYKSELEEQNLVPTQLIEEKVAEEARTSSSSRHYSDDHRERGYRHREHKLRDDHHRDRDMHSRRDYGSTSSSTRNHHHRDEKYDRRRSRSPTDRRQRQTIGRCRFSQEEIHNENAIRAKLGLKPLKI